MDAIDSVLFSGMTADDFNDMMDQAIAIQPEAIKHARHVQPGESESCRPSCRTRKDVCPWKAAQLDATSQSSGQTYAGAYFTGIRNTLVLAVVATLIGCVIGLLCGILQHHSLHPAAIHRSSASF